MSFARESIFFSAIRSLCNSLGFILGAFLAIFVITMAISSMSGQEMLPEKSELTIAPDSNGHRSLLPKTTPVILKINIEGVIGLDHLTTQNLQNILYDSREEPLGKDRVRAIFLYVNTPGGLSTDSEGIYQALLTYKKKHNIPVYAFVEGMCASGGMYICAAADKIYATSGSIIGSIGVILGPNFNFSDLMTKTGVQSLTLTAGKDKDALNPFRPWKEGEDSNLVTIIQESYEQFVSVMTTARPSLNKEKLIQEYGAHIFMAKTAKDLGYIDVANASYSQAMEELATSINLTKEYQVLELNKPQNFFSQLAQNKFGFLSGKVEHVFSLGPYARPELSGKLLYLYQP